MSVVQFPGEKERLIWTCAECHCSTFYLYSDDTSECASCGLLSGNNGEWVRCLEVEPPETTEKTDAGYTSIINFGSPEIARKRVFKKIEDWGDDIVFINGIHNDGQSTSWYNFETKKQKKWLLRKLKGLIKAIKDQKVDK